MNNILIVTSGTGGHVYPGIALAYELKNSGYNPVFIVNDVANSVSLNIVKKSGYDYKLLNFYAPPRKISLKMFLFPFNMAKSIVSAFSIISETKPLAAVGMGAYLSVPVLTAAKIKKIPIMIHEQNSIPGLANRLLSKIADKTAVSFKQSARYFCALKTVYTSNPVRKDIFSIPRRKAAAKLGLNPSVFTVFIFGGSLGSKKLNEISFNTAVKLYGKYKDNIQFVHITGTKYFEELNKKYSAIPYKKFVISYMHEIGNAYACSDFVLCRAGAGTVKEIEMYGLKAVFVPYPEATDNHQYFNAKNANTAWSCVIEEKNLKETDLYKIIEENLNSSAINIEKTVMPEFFPQEKLLETLINLLSKNNKL